MCQYLRLNKSSPLVGGDSLSYNYFITYPSRHETLQGGQSSYNPQNSDSVWKKGSQFDIKCVLGKPSY